MTETNKPSFLKFIKGAPTAVKLKMGAVALTAVTAVSLSGVSIYRLIPRKSVPIRRLAAAPEPKPQAVEAFKYEYDLKKVSMPLADRSGHRIGVAQFTLALDLSDEKALHWMEMNRAKLLTIMFDVGSHFTFENLEAHDGLEQFKSQLMPAFQESFGVYSPRDVVLREWVTN